MRLARTTLLTETPRAATSALWLAVSQSRPQRCRCFATQSWTELHPWQARSSPCLAMGDYL